MKALLRTKKKERVIVFGAGNAGRSTYEYYSGLYEVIAFADNDPKKIGSRCCGRPVVGVSDFCSMEYDYIIIGSSFSGEITRQLVSLGIPSGKIGWVREDILCGNYRGVGIVRRVAKWTMVVVLVLVIVGIVDMLG